MPPLLSHGRFLSEMVPCIFISAELQSLMPALYYVLLIVSINRLQVVNPSELAQPKNLVEAKYVLMPYKSYENTNMIISY